MRFCPLCAAPVDFRIPEGDGLPRHVCTSCGYIHYENPRLVVGCIAEHQGLILLCRRAIEPRHGFWTLPAGFMENGETTSQGAARETNEEAGAVVSIDAAYALFSIAHIHQVHLFYRGHLSTPDFTAGIESLEVGLFRADEIPWDDLAFLSVRRCLEHYLEDRQKGSFSFHEEDLLPP
ncbi:MAG: NUDIX hydrolase [Rhodocyclaceae bacterium]|nr:NUDIX hydrolase [Rhodocyclaceae bacterium]